MPVLLSRPQPSRKEEVEDWPWLDQAVLRSSRSRQVCMTCHVFWPQSLIASPLQDETTLPWPEAP